MILKGELWSGVSYIRTYHPYRVAGERNPAFGKRDGLILDLKDGRAGGIAAAVEDLGKVLSVWRFRSKIVLVPVPGSKARRSNRSRPLARVIDELVKRFPDRFESYPDLFIRHRTIEKLAYGGDRDVSVHLKSIRVCKASLASGRVVMVIDDVTTTGNTLRACRMLLEHAKPSRIGTVALAKTRRT